MMRKPESLVPAVKVNKTTARTKDDAGWETANSAWIIVSHLLTGIALYAGLGWLLSLWLPNRPLLIAGGALVGMFLSIFLIYRRLEAMPEAPTILRRSAAVNQTGQQPDQEAPRGH
ncbi:MAG: hypothetical protein WAO41_06745 [Candidatus Nanopelagicales bacterium]